MLLLLLSSLGIVYTACVTGAGVTGARDKRRLINDSIFYFQLQPHDAGP